VLYSFDDLSDYIDFELSISPDVQLTAGPFSHASQQRKSGEDITGKLAMFNSYKEKYGNCFVLIKRNFEENKDGLFLFSTNGVDFFGVFDERQHKRDLQYLPMNQKSWLTSGSGENLPISEILKSLDYTNEDDQKIIFSYVYPGHHIS
jgi:hypothetical protein